MRFKTLLVFCCAAFCLLSVPAVGQWQAHEVLFLTDPDSPARIPAQFQIVTERWNRLVAVPYLVYMPDKERLLMLICCDYPHRAFILTSDDRGAHWTDPRPACVDKDGKPTAGLGTGLAYLGNGNALFYAGSRWFSRDYGQTWGQSVPLGPTPDGRPWHIWDPPLVDRDPNSGEIVRLVETGYTWHRPPDVKKAHQQGYIRFSTDLGETWSKGVKVPQWKEVSEVALAQAATGRIVAACRMDSPTRFAGDIDHYEGLAVSISRDNGQTWSPLNRLYAWGRHHPSMVVLPDGRIVMTYVVRKGYTDTADGQPRFGIEAIQSCDHGQTWDLDRRFLLHTWRGDKTLPHRWWPSSQATSSVLLPDGSIMTAFGTGYRCRPVNDGRRYAPRDVGLVRWRPGKKPASVGGPITSSSFDSEGRNVFELPP